MAFLLSVLLPGLGQVYNGQTYKAVAFYVLILIVALISAPLRLFHSFAGLGLFLLFEFIVVVADILDAVWVASRTGTSATPLRSAWRSYVLVVGLSSAIVAFFASGFYLQRIAGVRGFRMTSASGEPAFKLGDSLMADMRVFSARAPRRGELIIFEHPTMGGFLYIKRIIAVEGDTIETDGPVCELNGESLRESYLNPISENELQSAGGFEKFGPLKIPAGKVFVLGDNRLHSWDSRHFGPIDIQRIKGKPLYIYRSADRYRIGKSVE